MARVGPLDGSPSVTNIRRLERVTMSKSTISTFQLFEMFPDAEAARVYMEGKRWPQGAVCPACDAAGDANAHRGRL